MLIGDLTEIPSRSMLANPLSASIPEIRDAFLATREALRVCAHILQKAGSPGRKSGGLLLCGSPGTGKTHIIRYAEALLAAPGDPGWDAVSPFFEPDQLMPAPTRTLVLALPPDPGADLSRTICEQLMAHAGNTAPAPPAVEESAAVLTDLGPRLVSRAFGLLVLEGLPRRLAALDTGRARAEAEFCALLIKTLSECGLLVVVTALQTRTETLERTPLGPLATCCEIVPVNRRNLADLLAGLTGKTDAQRNGIRRIVEALRGRLPLLASRTEDAVQLYPFHTPLFEALLATCIFRPGFAPLEFAAAALRASRQWPAERLVTVDVLFDYLLPGLREDQLTRDTIGAFDECMLAIQSTASAEVKPLAAALLKGIAFGAVCGNRDRSVKWLTHQVLPGQMSGFSSAYPFACAVLTELEGLCRGKLVARGGGLDRRYGLASQDMIDAGAPRRESLRLRSPLMLYDWIHTRIPCWNPEYSAKYSRHSQTLIAAAPEDPSGRKGIVHFQSPSEPPWSDEDLRGLKESGAAWALLIMPAFERLEAFHGRIRQITAAWERILVWQPDAPTLSELRVARKIAPAFSVPARSSGAGWRKARRRSQRLLQALYVGRGLLFSSADHWSPSAVLEGDSLPSVLSRALLSSTSFVPDTTPARPDGSGERMEKVLSWVTLLTDAAERPDSEASTERHVLSWWAVRLEVDCSALVSRLHELPESFMTVRMGQEIRFFENSLGLIRSALQRLRNRELSLAEAIGQISAHFGDDEARLLKWRRSLDNFAGLARWLPAYEYARDYVASAFDTGRPEVDERRSALLQAGGQPHRMLEATNRDAFDMSFLQFKQRYIEAYSGLHEEALGRIQDRVDPAAVRTLELLSRLEHGDTTWYQKVQLIARWARSNQCDLPVRDILDRYPRCYCNFNPSVRQHVAEPVTHINTLVREGTEYFRNVLRNARAHLVEELKVLQPAEETGRQIAALLGGGPATPIGPDAIDVLNLVIRKHPDEFRREFRQNAKRG